MSCTCVLRRNENTFLKLSSIRIITLLSSALSSQENVDRLFRCTRPYCVYWPIIVAKSWRRNSSKELWRQQWHRPIGIIMLLWNAKSQIDSKQWTTVTSGIPTTSYRDCWMFAWCWTGQERAAIRRRSPWFVPEIQREIFVTAHYFGTRSVDEKCTGIFIVNTVIYRDYLSMEVFYPSGIIYVWVIMCTAINSLWRRYVCCWHSKFSTKKIPLSPHLIWINASR